jgi:hypothetical protein
MLSCRDGIASISESPFHLCNICVRMGRMMNFPSCTRLNCPEFFVLHVAALSLYCYSAQPLRTCARREVEIRSRHIHSRSRPVQYYTIPGTIVIALVICDDYTAFLLLDTSATTKPQALAPMPRKLSVHGLTHRQPPSGNH